MQEDDDFLRKLDVEETKLYNIGEQFKSANYVLIESLRKYLVSFCEKNKDIAREVFDESEEYTQAERDSMVKKILQNCSSNDLLRYLRVTHQG